GMDRAEIVIERISYRIIVKISGFRDLPILRLLKGGRRHIEIHVGQVEAAFDLQKRQEGHGLPLDATQALLLAPVLDLAIFELTSAGIVGQRRGDDLHLDTISSSAAK